MPEYKKIGYLTSSFKIFHIKDQEHHDYSYHYHDFHKILILLNGDITYCIEGRTYELAPNDIVLVNAKEVHRPIIKSDRTYERIILYISPDFLTKYQEPDNDLSLCLREAAAEQSHVLRFDSTNISKLNNAIFSLEAASKETDYASALHCRILFLEFMIQLNRAAIHHRVAFIGNSPSNEKIVAILNYINEHLTEDLTIDGLCTRFFLSRYYLMHMFKEQTGYTIGGYLSAKRLLLAKDLIADGNPITEVCYTCGFKNYSTFSRAYKKSFGESPREFRQSLSQRY